MRVRCAGSVGSAGRQRCPDAATTRITWSSRTVDAYCPLHATLVVERSRLDETFETVVASEPLGHPLIFTILRPWRDVRAFLWFVFFRPMPPYFDDDGRR